jgi:mevalonate kinase
VLSSCGKLILFGEHAVVYGRPALALGLPQGLRVQRLTATGGALRLRVPAWRLAADDGQPGKLGRVLRRLRRLMPGPEDGFAVEIDARLPAAAGLGSSAALAVLLVRCLARVRGQSLAAAGVRAAAHRLERIFHGRPSGLDDTVASFGGLCLFQRGGLDAGQPGWGRLSPAALQLPYHVPGLVIGDSRVPRATAERVADVRRQHAADPERVEALFERMAGCLRRGVAALAARDAAGLGAAMNANQAALAELGLSCPAIERMLQIAERRGAPGAKLTGAGGGGCVVALAPGCEAAVAAAWREAGFGVWRFGPGAARREAAE